MPKPTPKPTLSSRRPKITTFDPDAAAAFIGGADSPPAPKDEAPQPTVAPKQTEGRGGAQKKPRAKKTPAKPTYPWEEADPGRKKSYVTYLPEPLHAKLKYIKETTGKSMHYIVLKGIEAAVEEELNYTLKLNERA
ncbi:MAG: hypothetical protein RhofKO_32050 [Rhodothermales bacterium]